MNTTTGPAADSSHSRYADVLVPAAIGGAALTAGYLAGMSDMAYGFLIMAVAVAVATSAGVLTRGPDTGVAAAAGLAFAALCATAVFWVAMLVVAGMLGAG